MVRTTVTKRWGIAATALAAVMVLGACATPDTAGPGGSSSGAQDDSVSDGSAAPTSEPDDGTVDTGDERTPTIAAAWVDAHGALAVVTWGSSSCEPMVDGVAGEEQTIEITLAEPSGDCTDDFVPRGVLVQAPDAIDLTQDVAVSVTGQMTADTDVAPFAGEDADADEAESYSTPIAAWTNVSDVLVLVTWGSSSCPFEVDSVEDAGDGVLAVDEKEAPADQVCTMDIAPHVSVIDRRQEGDGDATTLRIASADGDPVDVPIAPAAS